MRRDGSLTRRVALWTSLIVLGTLLLYGGVVYLLVRDEIQEGFRLGPPDEIGEDGRNEVLLALLLAGPIALGAGAAAALVLARRALAPLDGVILGARQLGAGSLHQRLPVPAREDELHDLVVELNALLARLEDGFLALSRHTADASHELRTPLAVMAAELEVALRHPRSAEEWQAIGGRTLDELRRLVELVAALLELSRAGRRPEGERVDVGQLVRDVAAALAGRAEAGQIALAEPPPELGLTVVGHRGALEGALRNLVGNALRYTPAGGRVELACLRVDGGLRIVIDDSGPGVAPEERAAIFTPFTRGAAGKAAGEGVGLGLAIARRVLVEGHGGRLEVEPSPLGGARFVVELPA